jgi:hypothetical protein
MGPPRVRGGHHTERVFARQSGSGLCGSEPRPHELEQRSERRIERLGLAAARLSEIRPAAAAPADLRGDRACQLARLEQTAKHLLRSETSELIRVVRRASRGAAHATLVGLRERASWHVGHFTCF